MASIFLAELDADVIGLGEDCTNPFFEAPAPKAAPPPAAGSRKRVQLSMEIEVDDLATPVATQGIMRTTGASTKAAVSVSDCLACSGCVTSAEAVLLDAQSAAAFSKLVETHGGANVAVLIDKAALASLADALGVGPAAALAAAKNALRSRHGVLDAFAPPEARELALLETLGEFEARLAASAGTRRTPGAPPPPSLPASATRERAPANADAISSVGRAPRNDAGPLPLVVAACPGVVCFFEKTAPHGLPFLSSAKSPMASAAALLRAGRLGRRKPLAIAAIAPCADKKLEAARRDLAEDGAGGTTVADVDLVLTARELVDALGLCLLRDSLPRGAADPADADECRGTATENGASGGYADFVVRSLSGSAPEFRKVRNADFLEAEFAVPGRAKPLRVAIATGFRNVQRVATALKRGTCAYDFVELMACPRGCANGGGQLSAAANEDRAAAKGRVDRVAAAYHAAPVVPLPATAAAPGADLAHTRYHNIPPLDVAIKW